MIEIGGRPVLWHILKIYSYYGVTDFVILCGYKGYMIKEFFANYVLHTSDITVDMINKDIQVHESYNEPWRVTLLQTGEDTNTGGRLGRARDYLRDEELFFVTYGDGLSDIDIQALMAHHQKSGRAVTLTAVTPPGRFGAVELNGERVVDFREKPDGESLINGGFFVMTPRCFDYIEDDRSVLEVDVLPKLADIEQVSAYQHNGFWRPMDTLRDKIQLEEMWKAGTAPWKTWEG